MILFTLGMLTVIAVALITLFTISTIKVYKLQKQIQLMNDDYYRMQEQLQRRIDSSLDNIYGTIHNDRKEMFDMNEKVCIRLEQLEQKTKKKK